MRTHFQMSNTLFPEHTAQATWHEVTWAFSWGSRKWRTPSNPVSNKIIQLWWIITPRQCSGKAGLAPGTTPTLLSAILGQPSLFLRQFHCVSYFSSDHGKCHQKPHSGISCLLAKRTPTLPAFFPRAVLSNSDLMSIASLSDQ